MKRELLYFTFFLLICLIFSLPVTAQVVNIPDPNLRAAIEAELGKASGAPITVDEMATLTGFAARDANISDLTGLEHATNLRSLGLDGEIVGDTRSNSNSVSDLSPLVGLTNLTELWIGDNSILDLSPLMGLTNLTWLTLENNLVSDISAMAGLTNLTELLLDDNNITDISPLSGLTNLTNLGLSINNITNISRLVGLTNLEVLGLWRNSVSDLSPLAGLTNLESLFLDGNGISDLSPLVGLIQLTRLALEGNNISDISALAGLTNLTWLRLGHNHISDLSPLVANTGLGSGDQILLNNNPLSYLSIKTHIPTLQSRGVTFEFDDVTHLNFGEPRMVRLIYFLPNDRSPQQNIDTKLDTLIRDVQQFYADEMEHHNLGRKTFTFETDATGKVVVHHVDGQFTDSYYRQNSFHKVWEEIREQFYTPQNIYFIAIDIGNERVGRGYNEVCGVGDSHGASGGHVLIPASGDCFNLKTAAHELGHTFGLQHDFRSDTYIMSFGRTPNKLSECAAEWLDIHRYFNVNQNQSHFDSPTTIQMLSPLASPPYAIGLRFEVTDPDGVHQVQLLTPATIRNQGLSQSKFLSCEQLNGETDTIVIEFNTNQLTVKSSEVTLSVIDAYGNIASQMYPIDITTTLPTETVSIPDKNQVINIPDPVPPPFTVREAFELDPFFQQWIDVVGFPVVASEMVNPYALKEAAWQIWQMIGHRLDVLQALVQNRVHFTVIGYTELLSQVPGSDQGPDFLTYQARASGGSGLPGHPQVSTGEENLLHYPGGSGPYSVLIHEFAHTIHLFGLNTIDPAFDSRLKIAYDAAMEKGLWQGTYASSDMREYWAEGTHAWFYPKGWHSFNNYGNTRQALKAYDPGIAALLDEIYGDSEWRYTPSTVRTHLPHLQGFDPQDSPTFQGWPELEELYRQFRNPDSDGGDKWVDLRPYDPNLLPSLNESRTAGSPTGIGFINLTQADVLLYGVRYDGTEEFWTRVPPGYIRAGGTTTNEMWLVKDLNGKNLAVFQALEKPGRALIGTAPILITPGLSKVSGDNQTGVPGAVLANPFVVEVRDENGLVLEGVTVTFTITTGGGTPSVTSTMTAENGAAQSTLTLGPNLGTNTVSVSAVGIEGTVSFNATAEAAIDIPDTNLRAAVEAALDKAKGDPITPSEMAALTHLEASETGIRNLTGLEGATNLIDLGLWKNSVKDLSPLAGLTNLTGLYLGVNSAPDLSPLAELTNLESLFLDSNGISNLSPLAGLTKLTRLAVNNNSVSDLSPLVGLTNLKWLRLASNNISDLSPLVANTGLGSRDEINVKGNPLSYLSIHTHIPALQSRGVTVEFDNRSHPAFLKILGDNQNGASFAPLSQPFVVEAQDANGSALAGVSVTFAVTAGGGTLNTTITRTNENGRAQSTLTLGPNLGTNTVEVSAAGIEVPVTFHAISDTEAPPMAADVNSDGVVNILDLILIASSFGGSGQDNTDVNRDGVVNVLDLVLAAGMFDGAAAAPSAHAQVPETLTAVEVQGWLTDARALEVRNPITTRGFVVLEQLLISLTPTETELLANYPNPFNPETWIPYRLAEDAFVTLTIYDESGRIVRTLNVGHRIASAYENRSKAIYWDGRNEVGEQVASGVYFYNLSTGNYSATRRMVILK